MHGSGKFAPQGWHPNVLIETCGNLCLDLINRYWEVDLNCFEDVDKAISFHQHLLPCKTGLEELPVAQGILSSHKCGWMALSLVIRDRKFLNKALSNMKFRVSFSESLYWNVLVGLLAHGPVLLLIFPWGHLDIKFHHKNISIPPAR